MMAKDTSTGWNAKLGTVDASNEWWEEKIKMYSCTVENKEYAKFHKHGFKFKQELEFCFVGTYATGGYRMNHEDSDGFDTWLDDDSYVPEPPFYTPPRVQSVTPTHATGSLGKRSSHMSGCKISKKRATTKDDTMNELVQAVQSVAGKLNSPSHDSSMGYGRGQSQYGIATAILKKMLHDQHMSTELYLFAVDLLRDNITVNSLLTGASNKLLQECFQHSGEIISHIFRDVMHNVIPNGHGPYQTEGEPVRYSTC
ncbi:uncharacterized protein LOC120002511 [Tripterygium wilfordii]|uniref:uncharacterized protein LOC120002511 n=1 Tax=Tripterygium wilfordii TaxID=458696 RepID=UPI0018F85B97|nr:uncharacterized protein LOC120002511 [Tripterygium wilfordii]